VLAREEVGPDVVQPVALPVAPEAVEQDVQAEPEVAQQEVRAGEQAEPEVEQQEVRTGEQAVPEVELPVEQLVVVVRPLAWALCPA
jgi:hypothetical protein